MLHWFLQSVCVCKPVTRSLSFISGWKEVLQSTYVRNPRGWGGASRGDPQGLPWLGGRTLRGEAQMQSSGAMTPGLWGPCWPWARPVDSGARLWLESPHGPCRGSPSLSNHRFPLESRAPWLHPLCALCLQVKLCWGPPGALLTASGVPQQPYPVSHPYLAESGLESQWGGRLRALHAGRGGGEGPGAVHPMAPCPGHWTPRLGCTLHVCPRESFCTKSRKENPCVHTWQSFTPTHHGHHCCHGEQASRWGCTESTFLLRWYLPTRFLSTASQQLSLNYWKHVYHYRCSDMGYGGLVTRSCLTLATPWTDH